MKEIQLATEWGLGLFFECPVCAALVREPEKHLATHETLEDRMVRMAKEALLKAIC